MSNFIEKIQKINILAEHLLKSGKAKDSIEAQRMAEDSYGESSEMAEFNQRAEKTVKTFQNYGDAVKKNDMRQPKDWKEEDTNKESVKKESSTDQ